VAVMNEVCPEQSSTEVMSGKTLDSACKKQSSTKHASSEAQQSLSGAGLNRANWHPNDHHTPLTIVYT